MQRCGAPLPPTGVKRRTAFLDVSGCATNLPTESLLPFKKAFMWWHQVGKAITTLLKKSETQSRLYFPAI
jgi:hypothetical protein